MKNAIFIVDVQNDFIEGGSLAVNGGEKVALDLVNHLATTNYDYVITSQDWHKDPGDHWADEPDYVNTWPVHCAAGTEGAAIRKELAEALDLIPQDKRISIVKGEFEAAYSGFEGRALGFTDVAIEEVLAIHNIATLSVVGLATDHCVKATAKDAIDAKLEVIVLKDFIAGVDPARSEQALIELQEAGVTLI